MKEVFKHTMAANTCPTVPEKDFPGIYEIFPLKVNNGKLQHAGTVYVGRSIEVYNRIKEHLDTQSEPHQESLRKIMASNSYELHLYEKDDIPDPNDGKFYHYKEDELPAAEKALATKRANDGWKLLPGSPSV